MNLIFIILLIYLIITSIMFYNFERYQLFVDLEQQGVPPILTLSILNLGTYKPHDLEFVLLASFLSYQIA